MKWFVNLSTQIKMVVAFGVMWILLAGVIVVAYQNIAGLTESEQYLHDYNFEIAMGFRDIRSHQNYIRGQILEMLVSTSRTVQQTCIKNIQERSKLIDATLEKVVAIETDAWALDKIKEVKSLLASYRTDREQQVNMIASGSTAEAQSLSMGTQAERFEKIRSILMELGDDASEKAHEQLDADQLAAAWSIKVFFIIGGIAVFGVL